MDYKTQAELRRRKILASAEARLRKIRRITIEDVEKESDEQESNFSQLIENDIELNETVNKSSENFLKDRMNYPTNSLNGDVCNGLNNLGAVPTVPESNEDIELLPDKGVGSSLVVSPNAKKEIYFDLFVFTMLGVFIRILYHFGFSSIYLNNILGPFLVVCLPRVILYIRHRPELPGIISLIIFLSIDRSKFRIPFRIFSCLRIAIQFLALYLFSFFVTHFVIKELKLYE